MKFRRISSFPILLLCLSMLAGCSSNTSGTSGQDNDTASVQDSGNAVDATADADNAADPASAADSAGSAGASGTATEEMGDIHITVESVEISLSELAAQNYTVPLLVSLDKNAGITYSEWGVTVDSRCTFEANNKGMDFTTYYSINNDAHFLWTAWTSGTEIYDFTGTLLQLNITLPRDASAGDCYTVTYADWSLADKAHIWSDGSTDWAEDGSVTWTDGKITVIA